jgi:hypothetical protein
MKTPMNAHGSLAFIGVFNAYLPSVAPVTEVSH